MTSLTTGGQTRTSAYNGDGTLVSQVLAAVTTRYTQDLASPLSQILADGTNTSVYGTDRLYSLAGATRTWYTADALGSVRALSTDTAVVSAAASYDPYGRCRAVPWAASATPVMSSRAAMSGSGHGGTPHGAFGIDTADTQCYNDDITLSS